MSRTFLVIKTNRINQKYLTGLLNSKLVVFWLKNKGKMQGSNFQIDKEPLLNIPIHKPTNELQELIGKLVDYIIKIKSSNSKINEYTTNNSLSLMFEEVIDAIVYQLYFDDLPDDLKVIELVEQSVSEARTIISVEEQINLLFADWNDYNSKLRNRIILQKIQSPDIATIEKYLSNESN